MLRVHDLVRPKIIKINRQNNNGVIFLNLKIYYIILFIIIFKGTYIIIPTINVYIINLYCKCSNNFLHIFELLCILVDYIIKYSGQYMMHDVSHYENIIVRSI